ncbi:hypothetical protein M885DRAFT_620632 [Pelagophyceae sp. CCMP2097]|nr:hypothetical protein M885DRAFT_620632 [Pelagophyceae sp. CCMP2097]
MHRPSPAAGRQSLPLVIKPQGKLDYQQAKLDLGGPETDAPLFRPAQPPQRHSHVGHGANGALGRRPLGAPPRHGLSTHAHTSQAAAARMSQTAAPSLQAVRLGGVTHSASSPAYAQGGGAGGATHGSAATALRGADSLPLLAATPLLALPPPDAPAARPLLGDASKPLLVGLKNLGNSCFMAAVLQCVLSIAPFVRAFKDGSYARMVSAASPHKGAVAHAFADLVKVLHAAEPRAAVSPKKLKLVIGRCNSQFADDDQEDSQEFLRFFLDALGDDLRLPLERHPGPAPDAWLDYRRSNDSLVTQTFCGQLRSTVECCSCHHVSICFDAYLDLSLPIPPQEKDGDDDAADAAPPARRYADSSVAPPLRASTQGSPVRRRRHRRGHDECSLASCLGKFTEAEILDRDNRVTCDRCTKLRKCIKRLTIHTWPAILVLHIKRFQYTALRRDKLDTHVVFPFEGLDLTPFVTPGLGAAMPPVYDLFATSNHIGGRDSGHYVAHCLRPTEDDKAQWYSFNDSHVSNISSDDVQGPLAYVLFYRLRGTS